MGSIGIVCSLKTIFILTTVTAIGLYMIGFRSEIVLGDIEIIYNHWPDNCTIFPTNGSEDIALFPNNQAIISSGLFFRGFENPASKPVPKLYLFDFEKVEDGLIELELDIDLKQFDPHGVGHWITKDGDYILYVISHQEHRDTVESFLFIIGEKRLKHRATFQHPLFHQLNDIVVVGLDEFYVTLDQYFSHPLLKTAEFLLRLSLSSVVYYDRESGVAKKAVTNIATPNGIAQSNNRRFIYVSSVGGREILIYKRNQDNSLDYVQALKIGYTVDNIFIDPTNDHMWVAAVPYPLHIFDYIKDRSYPVEGRSFHISLFEDNELPYNESSSKIEEVFETDGKEFGAVSVAVYSNNKLLLGTVGLNIMLCDNVNPSF